MCESTSILLETHPSAQKLGRHVWARLSGSPAGRDGAQAFDYFALALELVDKHMHGDAGAGTRLPLLAPPSPDTAVEGDVPQLLSPSEVLFSALTWTGRYVVATAQSCQSVRNK